MDRLEVIATISYLSNNNNINIPIYIYLYISDGF